MPALNRWTFSSRCAAVTNPSAKRGSIIIRIPSWGKQLTRIMEILRDTRHVYMADAISRKRGNYEGAKASDFKVAPAMHQESAERRKGWRLIARRVLFLSLTALTVLLISWRTFAMLQIN